MILKKFETRDILEQTLCSNIVKLIRTSIENYGSCNVLLSGGSTPIKLYEHLGKADVDWSKVQVGLVDERFVEPSSELNNHKNIEVALNKFREKRINVLPMILNTDDKKLNLKLVRELYSPFFERLDFCLLGMGDDGHTASLFPFDQESSEMLKDKNKQISTSQAPKFPKDRISCNKKLLLSSKKKVLMLIGKQKLKVLQDSIDENLPIAAFSSPKNQLKVYYTES